MKWKSYVLTLLLFVIGLGCTVATPQIAEAQGKKKHSAAWYRAHAKKRHSAAWYRAHRGKKHSAAWYKAHAKKK
jgi:hypothetical protein